ncbi:FecR domain-containing protein [Curvibacter sp. APW13]|uniref:FecR family protein n=1 Tax=Curvibacter sp. APW13 TaxID=3077236 RepID=UPI0028DEE258|nr:FecR domain-containing protein [Curvibacter sp. APW13]MDT8989510.1 FecR domain-containing protein [Curvibacter sp. APW13]
MIGIKAFVGVLALSALVAQAQTVGEVEFSRGVGFAQSAGQTPRVLGKGLPLKEGDRLTTSDGSSAIIKLQDGTRMTVRPNSDLVVQQYQFKDGAQDNSMVMQLLRGGFRAITGLISKGSPNAAKVQTATATIGIRGTDFDARLCTKDCKAESDKVSDPARPNAVLASAKLVDAIGSISARDVNGNRRVLVTGGSIYPGDMVETAAGARTVLVFRDDSRLTLGSNAQFRVDNFVFDEKNASEGRFLVTLLRGSLRALTGLIGKANNRNVGFSTSTATIGIRGTGLDLDCSGGATCAFYTWLGTIEVTPTGQTALQVLQAGQGLFVGPSGIRPLNAPTLDNLPRPDQVPVNLQQLFGVGQPNVEEEGLFVFVRDGHIEVVSSKETLHLGRGETGFALPDGSTGRPGSLPLFIQTDRLPLPNNPNPGLSSLMGDINATSGQQCR